MRHPDPTKLLQPLLWCALAACSGASGESSPGARAPLVDPGSGPPPAEASPPRVAGTAPAPERGAPVDTAALALPTECRRVGQLCLPPADFAERLCLDSFTGTAISLFSKSSPFSRGYVQSRSIKAINTLGGPAADENLHFGEEVVIVMRHGGPDLGGMQVSGMGGYLVVRWDGTCATLSDGEIVTRARVEPGHAPFAWKYIDTSIQEALLRDERIKAARKTQRQHCHGVSLGVRSASCERADAQLNERIVVAVRTGLELPPPDRLP